MVLDGKLVGPRRGSGGDDDADVELEMLACLDACLLACFRGVLEIMANRQM